MDKLLQPWCQRCRYSQPDSDKGQGQKSSSWGVPTRAAEKASHRKRKAVAEAEELRRSSSANVSCRLERGAMAEALAEAGKLSNAERPLAPAQIGRILQRLGLSGKPLRTYKAWGATRWIDKEVSRRFACRFA